MSEDRKESVENVLTMVDDASSTVAGASNIVSAMANVYQFGRRNSNRILSREVHEIVQDKIELQGAQLESPIQFEIALRGVGLYIEYPENMAIQERELIKREHERLGSRRYVEGFLKEMGVDSREDMDIFKDHPSYEMNDDGFTYTSSMNGCRYNVQDYDKEISTNLMTIKGLSATPVFEGLPPLYIKDKSPEKFDVDFEAIRENSMMDVGYKDYHSKQEMHELSHFAEVMMRGMDSGSIAEDEVHFIIRTLPMIYDVNDAENPKLTEYKVDANVGTLNRFSDDLKSIVQNKDSKNKGEITTLDFVQNTLGYIERSIGRVDGYELEDMSDRRNDFKTLDELSQMGLMVDGEIINYPGEGTHDGDYERNKLIEDTSSYSNMFTEEEIREHQALKKQRERSNEAQESAYNRKKYRELNEKFDSKSTPEELRKRLGMKIATKESSENQLDIG